MKSYQFPYSIVLVVVLVVIGFVGSNLNVYSASAEKNITIAALEYHPWTGKNLKFNGFRLLNIAGFNLVSLKIC